MSDSLIITESLIILAASLFPIGIISLILTLYVCCKALCCNVKETNTSSEIPTRNSIDGRTEASTVVLMNKADTPQVLIQMKSLDEELSFL